MWYFIDFENVNTNGLLGIKKLGADDTVVLFCSANNNKMDAQLTYELCTSDFDYRILKGEKTVKNYMDFWIVCECSRAVFEEHLDAVAIISKDKGYISLKDYFARLNKTIILAPDIANARNTYEQLINNKTDKKKDKKEDKTEHKDNEKKEEPETVKQELKSGAVLPGLSLEQKEKLLEKYSGKSQDFKNRMFEIVNNRSFEHAGILHFELVSAFGYKDGGEIYRFVEKMNIENLESMGKAVRKRA